MKNTTKKDRERLTARMVFEDTQKCHKRHLIEEGIDEDTAMRQSYIYAVQNTWTLFTDELKREK